MSGPRRLLLALTLAALAVTGLLIATIRFRTTASPATPLVTRSASTNPAATGGLSAVVAAAAPQQGQTPAFSTEQQALAPPNERFIEEQLAEAGEDLGAVFYMSRIREVAQGNPAFARELLRQMKAEHGKSPLIAEAETLVGGNGKKGGR